MIADVKPDLAAVIWDRGIPTRRSELQPAYKAQRPSMPDEMKAQEKAMQDLVPLLGVASLSLPDTEADDLIASYACQHDGEVIIATNDKDILQLVDERVRIYSTNKTDLVPTEIPPTPTNALTDVAPRTRGKAPSGPQFALLGVDAVRGKWGVEPSQIADVLALTGDASDNIPGVDGVGQKTAATLVRQFGTVEALLERLPEIKSDRTREKIAEQRQRVIDNRSMVALDLDLPLPQPIAELEIAPRYPELIEVIRRCEFRTLLAEIEKEAMASNGDVSRETLATAVTPPARDVQAELF